MALTKVGRSLLNTGVADSSDATAITISSAEDATFAGHILLADSKNIKLGAGTDLQLYHDGTNSYITNSTGALKIATETSGIAVTIGHTTSETTIADNLTVTGTVAAGVITADGLDMGDSEKIRLGAAQDLEIYHDGSHSYIYDGGTGNIVLKTNNGANVDIMGASEYMAKFIKDGAVELYYNDAKKLETTSAGITVTGAVTGNLTGDVTGNVSGTAATVTTAAQTNITSLGTLTSLGVDGAATFNESGAAVDFRIESDDDANIFFVDGSEDKIGIGTNAPAEKLHVLGDSAKIQLESNGSDTGVQLVLDGAKTSNGAVGDIVFENAGDTVAMIRASRVGGNNDAADMLFHTQVTGGSNAEKMRITSGGNVGVGITTPNESGFGATSRVLSIAGTAQDAFGVLELISTDVTSSNRIGEIRFGNLDAGSSFASNAGIRAIRDGADNSSALSLWTTNAGTFAEHFRIGSAGLIGMGDTPSNLTSEIVTITTPASGGGQGIAFKRLDSNNDQVCGQIRWSNNSTDDLAFIKAKTDGDNTSSALTFWTNPSDGITEVMRINKSGMMSIGDTTGYAGGHDALSRLQLSGGGSVLGIRQTQVTDGSHRVVAVFTDNGGTYRGRITINNSACSFTSASDYRLKENIVPLPNGLDRLNQLKPVKFKWKEHDYTSEGFIAHEVQEVYPDAVVGEKDDKVMQSIDYGKITPLLVKAIQEQQTIIDDLKSRIKTLEDA